jgi:protein involved in plasmid replication-relaxation
VSRRLTSVDLLALGAGLSARERMLLKTVARLRLASHAQLAALLTLGATTGSPISAARGARRVLARLTEASVLARLDRRVGGVRAGSAGYVYYLGPAGQRLVAYWQGRGLTRGRFRPEPGGRYVRHRLAVSELYVQAQVAAADGQCELLGFDVEPDCWRSWVDGFGGHGWLKPDAFVRLGLGAYEDSFFIEVDLASESRTVVARKARAYFDYFQTGAEQHARGVFPRVLWLTTTAARRAVLLDACARLPAEAWQLFTVALLDAALEVMGGQIDGEAQRGVRSESVG